MITLIKSASRAYQSRPINEITMVEETAGKRAAPNGEYLSLFTIAGVDILDTDRLAAVIAEELKVNVVITIFENPGKKIYPTQQSFYQFIKSYLWKT